MKGSYLKILMIYCIQLTFTYLYCCLPPFFTIILIYTRAVLVVLLCHHAQAKSDCVITSSRRKSRERVRPTERLSISARSMVYSRLRPSRYNMAHEQLSTATADSTRRLTAFSQWSRISRLAQSFHYAVCEVKKRVHSFLACFWSGFISRHL